MVPGWEKVLPRRALGNQVTQLCARLQFFTCLAPGPHSQECSRVSVSSSIEWLTGESDKRQGAPDH